MIKIAETKIFMSNTNGLCLYKCLLAWTISTKLFISLVEIQISSYQDRNRQSVFVNDHYIRYIQWK
jgi:hypothetical protein